MNLEDNIFKGYIIKESKLKDIEFKIKDGKFVYETKLSNNEFRVILNYNGKITGKLYDLSTGEEYTNFRIKNTNGFSSEIREEYVKVLEYIREKCFDKQLFETKQANNITKYILKKYNDFPEFLWKNFPTYAVFRKKENNKWYALISSVQLNKVNKTSASTKIVEIINVKVDKSEIEKLLAQNGVYEAFHMNKKNWVSIVLDETLTDSEIFDFIDKSYKNI